MPEAEVMYDADTARAAFARIGMNPEHLEDHLRSVNQHAQARRQLFELQEKYLGGRDDLGELRDATDQLFLDGCIRVDEGTCPTVRPPTEASKTFIRAYELLSPMLADLPKATQHELMGALQYVLNTGMDNYALVVAYHGAD